MGTPTRRSLFAAAAAAGLGAALAGCARGTLSGGAAPAGASGRIRLVLQPSGALPLSSAVRAAYQEALQPFLQANPGLDVVLQPTLWGGNAARILAGTAADVISDNYPPPYFAGATPLLRPLGALMGRDGVAAAAFSAGQIAAFRSVAPQGELCMLPSRCAPVAFVARLGDLAAAGLGAPDPSWDAAGFETACARLAAWRGPAQRGGAPPAVVAWDSAELGAGTWAFAAWGGQIVDAAGGAGLAASPNVAAGQWLYEGLFWPGRAGTRDRWGPRYGGTEVTQGRVSVQLSWGGLVLDQASRFTGFSWDFLPPPAYPRGPTAPANADFYAIPATAAHPEHAWSLLRFLTAEPATSAWPAAMVRLALLQPALLSLWPEWLARARATLPVLRGKRLEVFQELAASGRALPPQYWPRADQACRALTAAPLDALWRQASTVPAAFAAIDRDVNALLAEAAAAEAQARAAASSASGAGGGYAAPPEDGLGLPATPAGNLVAAPAAAGGAWSVLGDGQALGGTADTAVFLPVAASGAQGTWTCRLSALANLSCRDAAGAPALSPDLRVGLMARADLSDDAAFVAVLLAGDGSLRWANRPEPQVAPLEVAAAAPAPGALWLRLTRTGQAWAASTSQDGRTFTPLGAPQPCRGMGGAWIGPVACAGNGAIGGQGYVRAAFDQLSFTPTNPVQVGVLGVPPAAGPVPARWPVAPALPG